MSNTSREYNYNFEFYPNSDSEYEHDIRLSYDCQRQVDLSELHHMCKNFAIALGFMPESVEEIFGPDKY